MDGAVAGPQSRASSFRGLNANVAQTCALAAIILLAGMHLHLALTRSINWDEFYYFSQVVQASRGELRAPLQTIHVHLFQWLLAVPGEGVDRIIGGRLVMLGLELTSVAAIVCIARRFASRPAALAAGAAFLASGYVLQHGWSFRTDPLVTASCMVALAVLVRARFGLLSGLVIGSLLALAGMVSLKAGLLAVPFLAVAWLRWSEDRYSFKALAWLAAIGAVTAAVFAMLYWLHASSLAPELSDASRASVGTPAPANSTPTGGKLAARAGSSMFSPGEFPYAAYAARAFLGALPLFIAAVLTITAIKRSEFSTAEKVAIGGLLLPLATPAIYHNALPYFFPLIFAPVAAVAAVGIDRLSSPRAVAGFAIAAVLNGGIIWTTDGESRLQQQRDIQRGVSQIFPTPVAYFDFPSALPDHRKANSFLTRWGLDSYGAQAKPQLAQVMGRRTVPMVLTIDPAFNPNLLAVMEGTAAEAQFHPQDRRALQSTYLQFWGPVWVAGANVSAGANREYEVLVPGPYTVVDAPIMIDGEPFREGEIVELSRGTIVLEASGEADGRLIWGRNPKEPDIAPPPRPYWTDF